MSHCGTDTLAISHTREVRGHNREAIMMSNRVTHGRTFRRIGGLFSILALSVPLFVLSDHSNQTLYPEPPFDDEQHGPHSLLLSRPLTFELNQGQMHEQVKFVARAEGYDLFLMRHKALFNLKSCSDQGTRLHYPISMTLVEANPNATLSGGNRLQGTTSYFLGNDRSRWRRGIPNFASVNYREIYPGIDLVYYGSQERIEYDFVVSPGANPDDIRFELDGPERVELDEEGNLEMRVGPETMVFEAPIIYQEIEGKRNLIAGAFSLSGENQIGFTLDTYDPQFALVIDPVLTYATYLGGTSADRIGALTIDEERNIYVVASTSSADFPATVPSLGVRGNLDIVVAKISTDGTSLLYSTIMGGSRVEYGVDIEVDTEGNAYICGNSLSYDIASTPDIDESFPIVNGFQTSLAGDYGQDVVVAKLSTTGNLLYSSYLGANNDQDEAKAIAVDQSGDMYITGATYPSLDVPGFPIRNAFQPNAGSYGIDGFVTKFNPDFSGDASLVYSTYLGGQNTDTPSDIAVDGAGNAIVVGNTEAEDFPRVNAMFTTRKGETDGFITKLGSTGSSAVFSTYIGGDGKDYARIVKIDSDGFAYIAGSGSDGFPTTAGAYNDTGYAGVGGPILFKINPSGTTLEFSTFLLPFGPAQTLATDAQKNVYFPATIYANSVWRWVVNTLNNTGSGITNVDTITGLDFSNMGSYSSFEVDEKGNVFFAFSPTRTDLPTINPIQAALKGGSDLYIARTGKDYIKLISIYPGPTKKLWLPYTLRPGEEWEFRVSMRYGLFASNMGTIEIKIEDDGGDELASRTIQNVPAANDWRYNNVTLPKITVPDVEQSDSLFVKAYLTPDGHVRPIDSSMVAYKIVVHKWTFMFYVDGDNNLEGAALADVAEMNVVGSNDSLAIVGLLDRHPEYARTVPNDWAESRYFVLLPNGINKTRAMGELNMGDPGTLVNFVQWARQNFPADHYALVLWDHGGGWMAQRASGVSSPESTPRFPLLPPGAGDGFEPYLDFGSDQTNNDRLMSLEIQSALKRLPKSDILWICTCLNGMIENAYQYRSAADYYTASQDVAPSRGWDNQSFFEMIREHPDMTPREVATWIVQSYGAEYPPDHQHITQSAIQMNLVDRVVDEVDYLAGLLIEGDQWEEIDSALANTHSFAPFHYRDLYHFALNLKEESADPDVRLQCDRIMGTLYDCTVANYAGQPDANAYGLSIFFPTSLAAYDERYHKAGNIEFAEKTLWDEFLMLYLLRKRLPPGVEGPVIDTYEINDSFTQAYGPLLPEESYLSYIPYAGDNDFYFFTTGRTTSASIKLTSPQGINFDLKVMDANQQPIDSSNLDQEVDSVVIANLQPGTYYLEIITNNNFFEQPYTLELAYEGSGMGQIPLSFDDGEPSGGYYSDVAGQVFGSDFRAPTYPMKLEEVSFFINSTDGAGSGGDGSFYVWLADYYGTKTDPFKVTPSGTRATTAAGAGSWFAVDLSEKEIALEADFFVGIGYDGVNTPVLGKDSADDGRTFLWDDSTETWQALPLTAFIRAKVSCLESPHQVAFTLPEAVYGLPGTSLSVPLRLSNMADSDIDSLELTVSYDPTLLHLNSISFENTIGADWLIGELDTTLTGRVNIAAKAGTPLTADETLLNLYLTIEPDATVVDSSDIILERVFVNVGQILSTSGNARVNIGTDSGVDD